MSSPGRAGRGAVRSRRSAIDVAVIGTADPASRALLRALVSAAARGATTAKPGGEVGEARIGAGRGRRHRGAHRRGRAVPLRRPGRARARGRARGSPRRGIRGGEHRPRTRPGDGRPVAPRAAACASRRRSSPPRRPRVSDTWSSSRRRRPSERTPDNPVPLEDDAPLRASSDEGQVGDLMDVEQLVGVARDVHPGLTITAVRPAALVGDGVDTVVTRHFEAPRLLTLARRRARLAVLPRRRPGVGCRRRRGPGHRGCGDGRGGGSPHRRPTSNDSPGCAGSS